MNARASRRGLAGLALGLLVLAVLPGSVGAQTFTAACSGATGDVDSLKVALGAAASAGGPDSVSLGAGCMYTLTSPDNYWYGPNGLPPISSDVTIEGNGATISRSPTAPPFRLFFVGADPADPDTPEYVSPGPGALTLRELTLSGGLAKGGDSNGGGGGAGMGGAIFSQGQVVLERSTLAGNTAQGGSAVSSAAGTGGGGIGTDAPATTNMGGGFGPGSFGGGSGGASFGGGAGFRLGENGGSGTSGNAGDGGGPRTGLGGVGGHNGGDGGDGSGGGTGNIAGPGGAFGAGSLGGGGGVGGGGVGGGGGGGFGAGGGTGYITFGGGSGGFGGGGGGVASPTTGVPGAPGFGGGTPSTVNGGGGAGMGGAVFNMQGELEIRSSTLAGNTAIGGADNVSDHGKGIAGAVFNLNGVFTAVSSTFADNSAAYYSAQIYNLEYDGYDTRAATTTLRDTIVADGSGSPQWPYDLTSTRSTYGILEPVGSVADADVSQFNLVRATHAQELGTISGTASTSDPLLGPLQANGGPTATMALGPGSPAIDAGDAQCLDLSGAPLGIDQRGIARPYGAACDIGAYEVGPPPANVSAPAVRKLTVKPRAFAAAPRGPSALAGGHRGARVRFSLSEPADVRFTVARVRRGRKKGGARLVALAGHFARKGGAGDNRFRFTGRLSGHELKPGRYRLLATPEAGGSPGSTAGAPFRILR